MLSTAKFALLSRSLGKRSLSYNLLDVGITPAQTLVVLDAGDIASYSGSGQTWTDRSGNALDFFLGATVGAEASDPTFSGTAGGLSAAEKFTCDGGDYFRLSVTNPARINNMHKAAALFFVGGVFRINALSINRGLFGTNRGSLAAIGTSFSFDAGNRHTVNILNGSGTAAYVGQATMGVSVGVHFFGVGIDETNHTGFFVYDGVTSALTPTFTSPSAAAATHAAEVGSFGNATLPLPNLDEIKQFVITEGFMPSASQALALSARMRARG